MRFILEYLKKYPADNQPKLVPSGCYTDDTQMSLGIVEMMLDKNFDWYDEEAIADIFLECFKRDERRGYTPYLFLTLMNSRSGKELLSKLAIVINQELSCVPHQLVSTRT